MPGLYRTEVRIALPNVQDAAPLKILDRCVTAADPETGRAFFVLTENPLKGCELVDYRLVAETDTYRMLCPGSRSAGRTC